MSNSDRFLGQILAVLAIAIGLGASFFGGQAPSEGPARILVGRDGVAVQAGPEERYRELIGQTESTLRASERGARLAELTAAIRPKVDVREWRGVIVVELADEARTTTELIAAESAGTEREEGPRFHFVVDHNGQWSSTARWRKQRPWLIAGLKDPTDWIVIAAAGRSLEMESTRLLVECLEGSAYSRGKAATQKGWSGVPRVRNGKGE